MYVSFNWSPVVLGALVIIAIIVARKYRSAGVLLLALVLYLGVHWYIGWWWVSWLFWAFWLIGLLGLAAWYSTYHPRAVRPARTGSRVALAIVLVMALLSLLAFVGVPLGQYSEDFNRLHGKSEVLDSLAQSIKSQFDKTNADVAALRGQQNTFDTTVDGRLDKLEKEVAELKAHDKVQDAKIAQIAKGVNQTPSPAGLTTTEVSVALSKELSRLGWKAGEVRVATVDWGANPYEAGHAQFGHQMTTRQDLAKFLKGSSAESKAARQHMLTFMSSTEYKRLLTAQGYVPVQFTKKLCYSGNGAFLDGMFKRDGIKCQAAGDIIWVYVDSNGHVVWDASVRADCSNPGFTTPPTPAPEKSTTTTTHQQSPPPAKCTLTHKAGYKIVHCKYIKISHHKPPLVVHKCTLTHKAGYKIVHCKYIKIHKPPVKCQLPSKPGYKIVNCHYVKKRQSQDCMLNGTGCEVPNNATQSPQNNGGRDTGPTRGAPATQPSPAPSASQAPAGSSTDSNGTTTGSTGGTPATSTENGSGQDHTAPPPTNIP